MSEPVIGIERTSSTDVMELVTDVSGNSMQVAAVLVLDSASPPPSIDTVRAAIATRIVGVRRLRQRLIAAPYGAGRPFWVDSSAFDITEHVRCVVCPVPGDQQALLDVTASIVTRRLPADRPLWSATLISGLAEHRSALVVVFHHVLADGIGGLAVLARLVDGIPVESDPAFPRRSPSRRELIRDALSMHLRAIRRLPSGLARLRSAAAELGTGDIAAAPVCSLNRPIGPGRALATVQVDLAMISAAAHAYGGTVNDALVTAVTGALANILAGRGEQVDRLVVSIPVSARRRASSTELGNQVGVIRIAVPTTGTPGCRLPAVARMTRQRKSAAPGSSASLLGPVFRVMAKSGVYGWFVNRQHLVNTFVSNLRGPMDRLTFLGQQVTAVIPVSMISGNITVAFVAMSYAGTLTVTVVADPARCPDLPLLAAALDREFQLLAAAAAMN